MQINKEQYLRTMHAGTSLIKQIKDDHRKDKMHKVQGMVHRPNIHPIPPRVRVNRMQANQNQREEPMARV